MKAEVAGGSGRLDIICEYIISMNEITIFLCQSRDGHFRFVYPLHSWKNSWEGYMVQLYMHLARNVFTLHVLYPIFQQAV